MAKTKTKTMAKLGAKSKSRTLTKRGAKSRSATKRKNNGTKHRASRSKSSRRSLTRKNRKGQRGGVLRTRKEIRQIAWGRDYGTSNGTGPFMFENDDEYYKAYNNYLKEGKLEIQHIINKAYNESPTMSMPLKGLTDDALIDYLNENIRLYAITSYNNNASASKRASERASERDSERPSETSTTKSKPGGIRRGAGPGRQRLQPKPKSTKEQKSGSRLALVFDFDYTVNKNHTRGIAFNSKTLEFPDLFNRDNSNTNIENLQKMANAGLVFINSRGARSKLIQVFSNDGYTTDEIGGECQKPFVLDKKQIYAAYGEVVYDASTKKYSMKDEHMEYHHKTNAIEPIASENAWNKTKGIYNKHIVKELVKQHRFGPNDYVIFFDDTPINVEEVENLEFADNYPILIGVGQCNSNSVERTHCANSTEHIVIKLLTDQDKTIDMLIRYADTDLREEDINYLTGNKLSVTLSVYKSKNASSKVHTTTVSDSKSSTSIAPTLEQRLQLAKKAMDRHNIK